jgi:hypothetical protein
MAVHMLPTGGARQTRHRWLGMRTHRGSVGPKPSPPQALQRSRAGFRKEQQRRFAVGAPTRRRHTSGLFQWRRLISEWVETA